jgi:hypothetical protein
MAATTIFVHFELNGDRLALSLDEVKEVAHVQKLNPVPRAPAIVAGLANIRGRVVTLLDSDALYGAGGPFPAPRRGAGQAVVFAPPRDNMALLVRTRVQIGRGLEAEVEGGGTYSLSTGDFGASAPLGRVLRHEDGVVHLIPSSELAAYCEARMFERYRRHA